ncbi:AmmeMemoRadiSam system protein A [Acidaminobacter sp. JC074]|uniref:AmmeMemoRadiSam system protein A n=1 Tax=Acidaminobacter sp. JC074 TaxID=2530199 RepID=UPI001F0D833F|nr:AmmeMemoRadiSam system protein A [Acidaminobacter sp. JC074]MCH4890522.1 AmmeMemoRadiSam system protein A [Acidaminobacter sp. JC074]
MIKGTFLMPHPPIIIPEIGKGAEKDCQGLIDGLDQIGQQIKELQPDTILVITPHGPVFSDGIAIGYDEILKGDLSKFGYGSIDCKKKNDLEMVDQIIFESGKIDIPCLKLNDENASYFNISKKLDHGVLVPLHFVDKYYRSYKLVHITYGLFSSHKLYEFGRCIQNVIRASGRSTVVIASGDMSHCLKEEGPYNYHPSGPIFDQKIRQILEDKDILSAMFFDEKLQKEAGECGKRSIDIMLGALDGYDYDAKVYGYDGPFGVGYLAMGFENLHEDQIRLFSDKIMDAYQSHQSAKLSKESHFVKLARRAIEQFLGLRDDIMFDSLPAEMFEAKAGTFVSLKKHGALRGCIGTIGPTQDNVALEIVSNAVKAAFEDPRFPSLEKEELEDIDISVDVLLEPEKITSKDELDVTKYGVIVTSGYKRGLLLPNLEGIDTVDEQVRIAMQKGSISESEAYELERFEVVRYY